ncbi:O-fucosyltransferase 15 [Glycine max]|nr:O-fucosyltransferase 15 [Glycine max]
MGGDDFDWNIDDELEIENYNSSSSCLTLPNGDAGEASSSTVLANSKVLDHFVNMGFSREMVSKVIQEYGEENEDKLLEELLSYKVKSENNAKKASKYLALHLIFEIDMIAHSLCEFAGGEEERKELEAYREIHVPTLSLLKWTTKLRSEGLCPLTPEESILMLGALGFNRKMHIFVVGFNLYGGGSQLVALTNLYPKLVTKENLLSSAELESFANYSSQLAALDFIGCTASDAFAMTNSGSQLSSLVSRY